MNIHFFTPDPTANANYLDDNRLKKMLIENFQMFAEALAHHGCPQSELPLTKSGKPYRTGSPHKNHPCNVWLRKSSANLWWLVEYTTAMWERYQRIPFRGNENVPNNLARVHSAILKYAPVGELTDFPNCAAKKDSGIDFTALTNVHEAYKLYMEARWEADSKQPTWRGIL